MKALALCLGVLCALPTPASGQPRDLAGRWTLASAWSNSDHAFAVRGAAEITRVDGRLVATLNLTETTNSTLSGALLRSETLRETCDVHEDDAGISLDCVATPSIFGSYSFRLQREGERLVGRMNEYSRATFERAP